MTQLIAEFTVLGQPKSKGRPRLGNGRAYTPRSTLEAEEVIRLWWLTTRKYVPTPVVKTRVALSVTAYMKNDRNGDLDNIVKLVMDSLNKLAYLDDKQVKKITAEQGIDAEKPRTVIQLTLLEDTWKPATR